MLFQCNYASLNEKGLFLRHAYNLLRTIYNYYFFCMQIQEDYEYQIYSLYLDSLEANSLVVRQESYGGLMAISLQESHIARFIEGYNINYGEILEKLPLVNEDSLLFENKFSVSSSNVIMATSQELRDVFTGDYQEAWKSFFDNIQVTEIEPPVSLL